MMEVYIPRQILDRAIRDAQASPPAGDARPPGRDFPSTRRGKGLSARDGHSEPLTHYPPQKRVVRHWCTRAAPEDRQPGRRRRPGQAYTTPARTKTTVGAGAASPAPARSPPATIRPSSITTGGGPQAATQAPGGPEASQTTPGPATAPAGILDTLRPRREHPRREQLHRPRHDLHRPRRRHQDPAPPGLRFLSMC